MGIDGYSFSKIFVVLETIARKYKEPDKIIGKINNDLIHEIAHGLLESDDENKADGLAMLLMGTSKYNYSKYYGMVLFQNNIDNCIEIKDK